MNSRPANLNEDLMLTHTHTQKAVKSLQLIWRSGTRRFHLRVPDLQNELQRLDYMTGYQDSVVTQQWLPGDMHHLAHKQNIMRYDCYHCGRWSPLRWLGVCVDALGKWQDDGRCRSTTGSWSEPQASPCTFNVLLGDDGPAWAPSPSPASVSGISPHAQSRAPRWT